MSQLFMRRATLTDLPEMPKVPAGYVLRSAQPDDFPGVAALLDKAFDDPTWDVRRVQRDLVDDPTVKGTMVVVFGNTPVATASVQIQPDRYPGSGVLHWVGTDPGHRGKKLGAIVSLAVLRVFEGMGCRDAVLLTDDDRLAAIKTYIGLGFHGESTDETHPARWKQVQAALDAPRT